MFMSRRFFAILLAFVLTSTLVPISAKPAAAAGLSPQWTLIEPAYDTVDTFVAGHSVQDYGAIGDGVTDVTETFQMLLDSLGELGGGTLFVPEGKYVIQGTLLIPKGVTMRGEWKKPVRGQAIQGTILMAYFGRGNEEATPFITQEPSSAVRDLNIWYPEQLPDAIAAYPPAIMFGKPYYFGNDFSNAKNITFVNAYSGVVFSRQNGGSSPVINGIYGTPLSRGIEIDNIADVGRIEWVDFSPDYWAGSGLPGSPTPGSSYEQWIYNNGTGIVMRRNDWSYSGYITVDGYHRGFHVAPSIASPGAIPNGHNNVLNFTNNQTAIYFETVSNDGIMFTNVDIVGSETGIEVGSGTAGILQLNKVNIAATDNAIKVDSASTTKLQVQQSVVSAGEVDIQGGTFMPSNSDFNNAAPQIRITENGRGIVTGNRFQHAADIEYTSQYFSRIDHTPVDMKELPNFPEIKPLAHKPARMALYVVTDAPFNASNDEVTDNTTAIQAALDQAAADGGGIVFLPPGKYRVDRNLSVPTGVELKGAVDNSTVPTGPGSIIEVYAGRNNPSAEPFLKLAKESGVRGITFNYPEQDSSHLPNMAAYPYLIRVTGEDAYVVNVGMRATYSGIDLFTHRTDRHDIESVMGHVFNTGIKAGGGAKDGRITNLHFNQIVYAAGIESKFGSWPNSPEMSSNQPVYDYGLNNLDFLILGDVQDQILYNNFHYGSRRGMVLESENGKGPTGTSVGLGIDGVRKGIVLEAVGDEGFDFINSQIVAIGGGDTQYIVTGQEFDGEVGLYSSDYWGGPGHGVQIDEGTVYMQLANFHNPGQDSFANLIGEGTLRLDNSVVWPTHKLLDPGTEPKLFAQSSVIDPGSASVDDMGQWKNNLGNQPVIGSMAPFSAQVERGAFDRAHPENTQTKLVIKNTESAAPISGTIELILPQAYENSLKPIRFSNIAQGETLTIDLPYLAADLVKFKFVLQDGQTYFVTSRVDASFAAKKGMAADQPQLVLGKEHFRSQGGAWKGAEDLSAVASLQWDNEHLYIDILVQDDKHEQAWQGGDIWQGDSLQVGLDLSRAQGSASTDVNELGFALGNDGTITKWRWRTPPGTTSQLPDTEAEITRDEMLKTTSYSIKIPFAELLGSGGEFNSSAPIGLALMVNENDGVGRSGFIEYHQGIDVKESTLLGELILLDGTFADLLTPAARAAVDRAASVKSPTSIDAASWHVALLPEGTERSGLQARLAALTAGAQPSEPQTGYYYGPIHSTPLPEASIEQGEDSQIRLRVKTDYRAVDRIARASVSESVLVEAFAKAASTSTASTGAAAPGIQTVIVPLDAVKGALGYALELPASYFNGTPHERTLVLDTAIGKVAVPNSLLLPEQLQQAGNTVVLQLEAADQAANAANQTGRSLLHGSMASSYPAVKLTLHGDNGALQWSDSLAMLTLTIPYEPSATEQGASELLIIGTEADGKFTPVVSSRFREDQQGVSARIGEEGTYSVIFSGTALSGLSGPQWGIAPLKALVARSIIDAGSVSQEQAARPITRAEFISQLVRTLELNAEYETSFQDVELGSAYAQEIGIAGQLGIVLGVSDNRFAPDTPISRQDAAVMIVRAFAHQPDLTVDEEAGDTSAFTDAGRVAPYALESLSKLVQAGIVQGSGGRLLPQGQLTRMESAAMLFRIYEQLNQ
ncbi:hypothetical protein EBB07_16180 [Paenibacillaceae bacterium]|nr:hypothetical protein EBB07_16180 [Paenibacillaceae bacterium]